MRTLNVCLLASSISFNALAADISRVVDGYDGSEPVHKYLKYTDTDTAFEAIPWLVTNQATGDNVQDKINLETILLANSKKIKNEELTRILRKNQHSGAPYKSKINFRSWLYTIHPGEKYTFETHASEDNAISCILRNQDGEKAFTITDFSLTKEHRMAEIQAENRDYHFDDETSYFIKQSMLKEAARISKKKRVIDFSKGVDKSNTVIAVDFSPGATEDQQNDAYKIMLLYTMPGILNKANVEYFREMMTTELLNANGLKTFDRFIFHEHFIDLTQKSKELQDLHIDISEQQFGSKEHLNLCETMVNLICDKYLLLYNNHIISAYLHALGGVEKVLFIPKTLYQLIAMEGFMYDNAHNGYNENLINASYRPTFGNTEVSDYTNFSKLLSLTNARAIKYAQNRGIDSIVFKLIRSMQKSKYISNNLSYGGDHWSSVICSTGMEPLVFSTDDSYVSLDFYKTISNIAVKEYIAQPFTWRVYHGGNKCKITKDYSTSFSDGLFSGCIYDAHSGCAASYAFKTMLFHCDINVSTENTNFYLPTEHTLLPMFGKGELHHVRTKIYTGVKKYKSYHEIPGFAFNSNEQAGRIIIPKKYPMIFTENPNEFREVTVYRYKNIDTYIANYTRYHIF